VRRAAVVFLAWGVWLGIWTAVQLLFLHAAFPERTIEWVMLGGASAATLVTGIGVWGHDRTHRTAPGERLIADESAATAAFAVGLAMALLGASFGLFLVLIGGGIAALGLGGLVREGLARSRSARRERTP
jgi:hypothetical protein